MTRVMSGEVIPLRAATGASAQDEAAPARRIIRRQLTYPEGMSLATLKETCVEQMRLLERYEGRVTAMLAKSLLDGLPPIETWVGIILGSDPDAPDIMVDVGPREQAIHATSVWPLIERALIEPPLAERLDVVVEAEGVVSLLSVDVSPALPVTRAQAQAMDLPVHLLFAKGEAFASVREEETTVDGLLAAWTEHRRLVDERIDDVLEDLRKAITRHELVELAGVVLSLGEEGRAVTAVTRAQARKLVAHHPMLARKLDAPGRVFRMQDSREQMALPIVVWAKGHVSVQPRDVVAWG